MYRPSTMPSEIENYNNDQSFYALEGLEHSSFSLKSDSMNEILTTLTDQQNDTFNRYFNNTSTPPPEEIDKDFFDNDIQGNFGEVLLFSDTAHSHDYTEELFQYFDALPGSSLSTYSQDNNSYYETNTSHDNSTLGIQFSEQCSLITHGYDASQNISNSTLQQDFLLRSDQDHNGDHNLNYSLASTSSSQFSQASYPPPFSDLIVENDQSQSSMSTYDKSDYDEDITFSANSSSRFSPSAPSPSPSCSSGKKRMSLEHLTDEEKYKRIRDQNNLASREYRQRKKDTKNQITDEFSKLSKQNLHLKQRVKDLQSTVDKFKELKNTLLRSGISLPVTSSQWPS